jgi:hypothetical protein
LQAAHKRSWLYRKECFGRRDSRETSEAVWENVGKRKEERREKKKKRKERVEEKNVS